MPSLLDPISEAAKILYIGESGVGKTGSKAALIAAGYKLRMIDTDRGFKILRALLTDPRYPYAAYIKKRGIDLSEPGRISYMPIEVPIDVHDVTIQRRGGAITYPVLSPTSSAAWGNVMRLLNEWKDGTLNLGGISDWDNDVVLDFDTLSSLAELAKFQVQDMNNRLGALEDDHGRDTGAAQELIRRFMSKLTSPSVRCNVIVTSHVTYVDTQRGAAQNPSTLINQQKATDPKGYPSAIGVALSPFIGKKWNDLFIASRSGSGSSAERIISSVPVNNTDAKHSAFVEDKYPLSTGLAEIFAALRYQDSPTELIEAIRGKDPKPSTGQNNGSTGSAGSAVESPFGSFKPR